MPDPILSREQRQRLHSALSRLPACATAEGRTRLLRGFPADMRDRFPPAIHQGVDLDHLIDAAHAWGPLPDGTLALRRLIENALDLGGDPPAEQELAALLHDVTTPAAAGAEDWRALLRQADALAATAPAAAVARRAQAWKALPLPAPQALAGHNARVRAVAATADGRIILSAADDVTLRLWTRGVPANGDVPSRILTGHGWWVTSAALTPDGRYVLSGSWDQTLRLWDVATAQLLQIFRGHTGPVHAVAVSPDGRRAVSGGEDGLVLVWDLGGRGAGGPPLRTLAGHTRPVTAVAVSPDGRLALSGSWDRTLRLWDLDTGAPVRTLTGHTFWVTALAFTPDGQGAVSGSPDETLRLWDLATGTPVRTFGGDIDAVAAVAVSPNGRYALTGARDGLLRIWDLVAPAAGPDDAPPGATGELCVLAAHPDGVGAVAVSGDGRTVVTGGRDSVVRLWTLPPGLLA